MSCEDAFDHELLKEIRVHVDNNYVGLIDGGFDWDSVEREAHKHLDQFVGYKEVSRHIATFKG